MKSKIYWTIAIVATIALCAWARPQSKTYLEPAVIKAHGFDMKNGDYLLIHPIGGKEFRLYVPADIALCYKDKNVINLTIQR